MKGSAIEIVAVDPGTGKAGFARMRLTAGGDVEIVRLWSVKNMGTGLEGGRRLVLELDEGARFAPSPIEAVIEVPTTKHRIPGKDFAQRPNTLPLLRLYQQVLYAVREGGDRIPFHFVESHEWNRMHRRGAWQRSDHQKKTDFLYLWPKYVGKRTNVHERDAALMGRWWLLERSIRSRIMNPDEYRAHRA